TPAPRRPAHIACSASRATAFSAQRRGDFMHALRLLRALTWPEWRHHAARQAVAVLAVALGVALAFSVQLINGSALSEFAGAVRSVQGEADLELRAVGAAGFDESIYARVGTLDAVRLAAP